MSDTRLAAVSVSLTVKTPCWKHPGFHCHKNNDDHFLHCEQCHQSVQDGNMFARNSDGTVSFT